MPTALIMGAAGQDVLAPGRGGDPRNTYMTGENIIVLGGYVYA